MRVSEPEADPKPGNHTIREKRKNPNVTDASNEVHELLVRVKTFHAMAGVMMKNAVALLTAKASDGTVKTEFENETTSDTHPRTMRQLLEISWMKTKLGDVERHGAPA